MTAACQLHCIPQSKHGVQRHSTDLARIERLSACVSSVHLWDARHAHQMRVHAEVEMLVAWVNTVCNLMVEEPGLPLLPLGSASEPGRP